ncbi:MAG: inorganic phosphate transporter, partial [Hyphomicrobiaceae bacterium]
ITMFGAIIVAAIFESAGALLAGGDVVKTISKGIITPDVVPDGQQFIIIMMAARCSAAVWVNLATYIGAPVSTTHAVVGGVVGAGIASVGAGLINWPIMAAIAASWVISPLIGGAVAALFLAFVKLNIIYKKDKITAARLWVPALVAIMAATFSAYLMLKGLKHVYKIPASAIAIISITILIVSFFILKPIIHRQSEGLENRNQSLRKLFKIPLIISAALLSFAHGANDVANAIGPLAGIFENLRTGHVSASVAVPFWIMLIGAIGISMGLFLFGPRLIRTVGERITRLNPIRAFCVALSAAITVIAASALGLPVSSTHIAVGAVFGVGFYREYFITHSPVRRRYLEAKGLASGSDVRPMLSEQEVIKRKLVRRSHFTVIIAAWLITVPAAALLSTVIYYLLTLVM